MLRILRGIRGAEQMTLSHLLGHAQAGTSCPFAVRNDLSAFAVSSSAMPSVFVGRHPAPQTILWVM